MNKILRVLCGLVLVAVGLLSAPSTQSTQPTAAQVPPAPQPVPVIDGAAGTCSVEFTVVTADGKPAAAANVKVHIAYGFGGFHKLDLEAGANSDGKVKFTGLPSRVRRSQLEFEATKGDLIGITTYDPAKDCQAKREITLAKPSSPGN